MVRRALEPVRRDFDPTLAQTLSAAALAHAWTQIVDVAGAYQRTGEPPVRQQADYTMVDLPLHFETGLQVL